VTPACQTSRIGEIGGSFLLVYRRVVIHCPAIALLLVLACVAFLVARFDEFVPFVLIGFALLLIFIASQIFWIGRILDLGERFIPGKPRRVWLVIIVAVVYLFVFTYSYPEWGLGHTIRASDYRLQSMLIAWGTTRRTWGLKSPLHALFAAQGIRMLRQERAPIRLGDETLNLIGIDHGSDLAPMHTREVESYRRLQQLKALVMPNTVNILLTHYPHFFGYPELGIDLTLAGDIHGGGQLSLDFIHRGLNLSSLMEVPYITPFRSHIPKRSLKQRGQNWAVHRKNSIE
jgi:hypothetical protein